MQRKLHNISLQLFKQLLILQIRLTFKLLDFLKFLNLVVGIGSKDCPIDVCIVPRYLFQHFLELLTHRVFDHFSKLQILFTDPQMFFKNIHPQRPCKAPNHYRFAIEHPCYFIVILNHNPDFRVSIPTE